VLDLLQKQQEGLAIKVVDKGGRVVQGQETKVSFKWVLENHIGWCLYYEVVGWCLGIFVSSVRLELVVVQGGRVEHGILSCSSRGLVSSSQ